MDSLNLRVNETKPVATTPPDDATATPSAVVTEATETTSAPARGWVERGVNYVLAHPGLSVLLVGLTVLTFSLATWVGALYMENKVLQTQLARPAGGATGEDASTLHARLNETQQQMTELQTQMEQQNTDQMITDQASLAGENARLLQDLGELSKPQLGAPVILLTSNATKQGAEPNRKDLSTVIDVAPNLALFTVLLQPSAPPAPAATSEPTTNAATPTAEPTSKPTASKNAKARATDSALPNYFLELTNQKGQGVTWSDKLLKAATPTIPLTFAKRSLAAGKYRLKLYALDGKKKTLLDQFDWQVNYLQPPAAKNTPRKTGR